MKFQSRCLESFMDASKQITGQYTRCQGRGNHYTLGLDTSLLISFFADQDTHDVQYHALRTIFFSSSDRGRMSSTGFVICAGTI